MSNWRLTIGGKRTWGSSSSDCNWLTVSAQDPMKRQLASMTGKRQAIGMGRDSERSYKYAKAAKL